MLAFGLVGLSKWWDWGACTLGLLWPICIGGWYGLRMFGTRIHRYENHLDWLNKAEVSTRCYSSTLPPFAHRAIVGNHGMTPDHGVLPGNGLVFSLRVWVAHEVHMNRGAQKKARRVEIFLIVFWDLCYPFQGCKLSKQILMLLNKTRRLYWSSRWIHPNEHYPMGHQQPVAGLPVWPCTCQSNSQPFGQQVYL